MKKNLKQLYFIVLIAALSVLQLAFDSADKKIRIGFLTADSLSGETEAAYKLLSSFKDYETFKISLDQISSNPGLLKNADVIWYHRPDSSSLSQKETDPGFIRNLKAFIENGGGLFLTLDAVRLAVTLGLEKTQPGVHYANAVDEGYGRKLGLHSFRSHPAFEGLNGGSYIWAPMRDGTVRQIGYFGDSVPEGKVAAVDWAYITLKEESKLMLEYGPGKGRVLSIGTYTYYEPDNQNRLQLELFTKNCLNYLSGKESSVITRFWNYEPLKVEEFASSSTDIKIDSVNAWPPDSAAMMISSRYASDNEWDTGGERILLMGKEKGGIDEIWIHPFMALRDYEIGIRFSYRDTIYWFNDQRPQIEIAPGSFTRFYKFPRAYITEKIVSDVHKPAAIIHYEYRGVYPAELLVRAKSNLRFMWPYSHKALGSILYSWDKGLNAFIAKNESDEFYSILGASKVPQYKSAGRFDGFENHGDIAKGIDTDKLQAAFLMKFDLQMNDNMNVVVAGTDEGFNTASRYYENAISSSDAVYNNTESYYKDLLNEVLMITTPDENFNNGYRWALTGTDRFFVNTPGIGKSLVAGYSTTAHGWDGSQEVNGRPGYAWYFGRDGAWSGMAILDYGDALKVKDILNTYQKYQDVNGKIFHELTTSGAVHYDAADATPLYVILAGKYLKWSGDDEFIRASWPDIKRAVDFLYSTDTDGDHLIENTNVGHGWVEGGELYGSKTTYYLAGCWAEALHEAEYIASSLGYSEEAVKYKKDFDVVQKIVNSNFWNTEEHFFNYGLLPDNTYNIQKTALPAVPVYFGLVDSEKAWSVLDTYAGNGFTADWGVRIISEDNPMFNPRGYHYGSIWPLFTGWTALAEYRYGNYIQGFSHIMNNLNVYKNWGKGFVEEVLNGEQYLPSGVCPHQCWSETMVLQPVLEGMLGLQPDALNNRLKLSPRLPADWNFIKVDNIRMGEHLLNFRMTRTGDKIVYYFKHSGNNELNLQFRPYFPMDTKITKVLADGNIVEITPASERQQDFIEIDLKIKKDVQVEIYYSGGISVLPLITDPKPGEYSEGFRILSTELKGSEYNILVQGKTQHNGTLNVYAPGKNIDSVQGGTIKKNAGDICNIEIPFSEGSGKYDQKEIRIKLK